MKNFLIAAVMLLSLASFAQNKFIEVEVTDTISLKPLSFQCNIYADSNIYATVVEETTEEDYSPMAVQEKQKNKLQEMKRKLEAKKYKVGPLGPSNGSLMDFKIFGGESENGFGIVVNSEAEVEKIKDLLKDDARVEVSVLKYADETKAEEQLIKKIMDKARARAAVIGVNSGLKTGKILEVKEGKQGFGFDMESYMAQIMKMRGMGRDNGDYTGSLSKTFVVKFVAE